MKVLKISEAEAKSLLALAKKLDNNSVVVVENQPSVDVAKSEPLVQTELPSAKKTAKAVKKAENQRLHRSIQAQLALATKASKSGDNKASVDALRTAMSMVPDHWTPTVNQILRKAESLGLSDGYVTAHSVG